VDTIKSKIKNDLEKIMKGNINIETIPQIEGACD